MGILVSKSQQYQPEFRFNVIISNNDITFECTGGEDVSAERIGTILCKFFKGHFNIEILETLDAWADETNMTKVMKIIQVWTETQMQEQGGEEFSVHPRNVFNPFQSKMINEQ